MALVAGTDLEHHRWHCLRRSGIRSAKRDHYARRWLGITVGGQALHEAKACLEVYRERRAALCCYVEKMGVALCTVTGPPSSGGWPGYERSFARWRQRHRPMAKFWEQLDRPLKRGEDLDLQDHQGQSRRHWAQNRRMEKVAELGEATGIDLMRPDANRCRRRKDHGCQRQ